jgi:hypothetical protein
MLVLRILGWVSNTVYKDSRKWNYSWSGRLSIPSSELLMLFLLPFFTVHWVQECCTLSLLCLFPPMWFSVWCHPCYTCALGSVAPHASPYISLHWRPSPSPHPQADRSPLRQFLICVSLYWTILLKRLCHQLRIF